MWRRRESDMCVMSTSQHDRVYAAEESSREGGERLLRWNTKHDVVYLSEHHALQSQ